MNFNEYREILLDAKEPFLKGVHGRYTAQDGVIYLAGSAAYMEFEANAGKVVMRMVSDAEPDEEALRAQVAVFINDAQVPSKRFALEKGTKDYEVFTSEGGKKEKVIIRLMKYSEQAFASVGIVSILTDGEIMPVSREKKMLIEFVGDSITCGYGNEGVWGVDLFTTAQQNPWEAYACKTARILDADYETICWSGNGMISHYIPPEVDIRRTDKPMIPEIYDYSDRELEERSGRKELTKWSPEREPDIVVVNIGTNDGSYTRNIPERNEHFRETYRAFLQQVREKHPQADIVGIIGIMEQCVHEEVEKAVQLRKAEGDDKVYYLKMPLQKEEDGIGTDSHPSLITHGKAAKLLAAFIKDIRK